MSVGTQTTKSEIDNITGQHCRNLNILFDQAAEMKSFLDTKTEADLESEFGYSPADATLLKTIYAEIYEGSANLAAAKDFRAFLRRAWGLGF